MWSSIQGPEVKILFIFKIFKQKVNDWELKVHYATFDVKKILILVRIWPFSDAAAVCGYHGSFTFHDGGL